MIFFSDHDERSRCRTNGRTNQQRSNYIGEKIRRKNEFFHFHFSLRSYRNNIGRLMFHNDVPMIDQLSMKFISKNYWERSSIERQIENEKLVFLLVLIFVESFCWNLVNIQRIFFGQILIRTKQKRNECIFRQIFFSIVLVFDASRHVGLCDGQ